jgi:hypothetical protein
MTQVYFAVLGGCCERGGDSASFLFRHPDCVALECAPLQPQTFIYPKSRWFYLTCRTHGTLFDPMPLMLLLGTFPRTAGQRARDVGQAQGTSTAFNYARAQAA